MLYNYVIKCKLKHLKEVLDIKTKKVNNIFHILLIIGFILLTISLVFSINNHQFFSNKSNIEKDYSSTLIAKQTFRENIVDIQVNLKQKRGELLKIKNERGNLKSSYVLSFLEELKTDIVNYRYQLQSLNVVEHEKVNQANYVDKLKNIEQLLSHYITRKDINQQDFEYFIKDLIGQINNL